MRLLRRRGLQPGLQRCRLWPVVIGLTIVAAACGDAVESGLADPEAFHPDDWPGVVQAPDDDLFDPVEAGEQLPDGFRQVLKRDRIAPVYLPTFTEPNGVEWPDDELVIGVDLEGEARAYPVGFLNRREIVVDMHRGIPTFVTW